MASPRHVHEVAAVHATTLLWTVSVRVQFEKRVITNGVAVIAIVNSSGSIEHDPPHGATWALVSQFTASTITL